MFKVAMVAACPFPANWGTPGAIREMATALSDAGHRIHVVTYPYGEELPVEGAIIERAWYWRKTGRLQSGPVIEKFLLDIFLLITLIRVIRREKIDVIHAHGYEAVLLGAVAKLLTGRPLIYHSHNLMSDELPAYRFFPNLIARTLGRVLDWMAPRFPDHVIALTGRLKTALLDEKIPAECVDVVPVSINPDMFAGGSTAALRARYDLGAEPIVMYTGICSQLQRLDLLLTAFVRVAAIFPQAKLMVVTPLSRDPDLAECREMADRLGIGARVIWVPGHRLQELRDYLALATLTVIPRPYIPGQPVKLLNAMSASRPTVCFVGGAEGMVHLRDAYIVEGSDSERLADGIIALLNDPELARNLGVTARRSVVENFSTRSLARRIEDIYSRVIYRTRSSRPTETLTPPKAAPIEPDIANG
ncbi:MAG TPA: glycosyltransferase family 4 protein [Candidatus Binataceae bacterium]|nr:glycosyltransferase family 4 protein [Candidatus Binataceae bacterium]